MIFFHWLSKYVLTSYYVLYNNKGSYNKRMGLDVAYANLQPSRNLKMCTERGLFCWGEPEPLCLMFHICTNLLHGDYWSTYGTVHPTALGLYQKLLLEQISM